MTTSACTALGIDLPIVLAPMAGAVGPELVVAVCRAGGLGNLPVWHRDPGDILALVGQVRAGTQAPFAANINLDFPQDDHLAACLDAGVPVISLFWGEPPPRFVNRAKDAGAVVMHTVGDAAAARRAVDAGVDVIVAQGWEAGGHVCGKVATMALVPAVVDAVGDTPVIAAGGLADGRGLAAVLALGAGAAWIGTRFLAADEASVHPHYRARILESRETDTEYTDKLYDLDWPDAPHRALRNSTFETWEAAGRPTPGSRPGEGEVLAVSPTRGETLRYASRTPAPDLEGDIDAMSMWAGQSCALVRRTQPGADIVADIMREARTVIGRLAL